MWSTTMASPLGGDGHSPGCPVPAFFWLGRGSEFEVSTAPPWPTDGQNGAPVFSFGSPELLSRLNHFIARLSPPTCSGPSAAGPRLSCPERARRRGYRP